MFTLLLGQTDLRYRAQSPVTLPLHEHRDHCLTVGIAILRAKGLLYQEHNHNDSQFYPSGFAFHRS